MSENIPFACQSLQQGSGSNNTDVQQSYTYTPQYHNHPCVNSGLGDAKFQRWKGNEGGSHYLIHDNTPNYNNNYGDFNTNNSFPVGTISGSMSIETGVQQFGSCINTWNGGMSAGHEYYPITFQRTLQSPYYQSALDEVGPPNTWGAPTMRHMQMPVTMSHFIAPTLPYNPHLGAPYNSPSIAMHCPLPPKGNHTNSLPLYGKYGQRTMQRPPQEAVYDEDFSEKLIAFARFNRNTTLIKEILSDVIMPNPRHIVSSSRLQTLREQVRLLEDHYKDMNLEVESVEKACSERKRKLVESTAAFKAEYEPLCRPAVGIKNYSEMFLKYYNHLKAKADQTQWEQTLAWAHQTVGNSSSEEISSKTKIINQNQNVGLDEILGIQQTQMERDAALVLVDTETDAENDK